MERVIIEISHPIRDAKGTGLFENVQLTVHSRASFLSTAFEISMDKAIKIVSALDKCIPPSKATLHGPPPPGPILAGVEEKVTTLSVSYRQLARYIIFRKFHDLSYPYFWREPRIIDHIANPFEIQEVIELRPL